jgi:hypothetical protein
MMNIDTKILVVYREKIPSWKVDIVQILDLLNSPKPRKTQISGHFRLITPKNSENQACNSLIIC